MVNQLFITIGILVAQVISLPALMGKADLWGYFMALTMVPAIIWLFGYGVSVESPRYLLIENNEEAQAKANLLKIRGEDANVSF